MKEWFSISDLASLAHPCLPETTRGLRITAERENWGINPDFVREVDGNGGMRTEYHYTVLPSPVQSRIMTEAMVAEVQPLEENSEEIRSQSLWMRHSMAGGKARETAQERHLVMLQLEDLTQVQDVVVAVDLIAAKTGHSVRTIHRWRSEIAGLPRGDWLPALCPAHQGRTSKAECHPDAWNMVVGDFLRLSEPSFKSCYERMKEAAQEHGWSPIPSSPTLRTRIDDEFGAAAVVAARKGKGAAEALYPAQERDKKAFHAMEVVNADGHVFDVFVQWEDGSIGRPCMIGFQDIYSGMVLSHRISKTENKETVRLAIADMVESWGIPVHVFFDNGRAFMSKWITGGLKHRFRFKVKEEEPKGVLVQLGVKVHNVTPYHGQAKPIERAWRDMVDRISRHPKIEGAFTGNKIDAKPENYRSRAIPIEDFRKFVAAEIMRHNNRKDRNTQTAKGRSFAEVFKESMEHPLTIVSKANAAQRQFFLLAGEGKTARRPNGEIHLAGNRYWHERLIAHAGKKLMIRFDPENLHQDLYVYTMDGRFIEKCPCIEATGFMDAAAAREHAHKRRQFMKATREVLEYGRHLTPAQVAALIPDPEPIAMPMQKVVGLHPETPNTRPDLAEAENAFSRGLSESLGVSNIFEHTQPKRGQ